MSQNGVQCSGWQMSLISMLLSGGIMLFFAVGLSVEDADAQSYSELWGKNGEQWHSKSRLPDFSRAGYHNGELEIPEVVVRANVKDFGAVGDGVADDTRAFKEAIAATDEGAIEIPPGRYVLAEPLHIKKRGIVLRGAGPDHTILVIPKSLQQLLPADQFTALGVPKLKYSFGGAFIEVRGNDGLEKVGDITAPSQRGDQVLVCENAGEVRPGSWIQLRQMLNEEMGLHMHAGLDAGDDTLARPRAVEWVARVVQVDGDQVMVDRPLRLDVRPEWRATLHFYRPTVEEVGIEGLAFEFPGVPKKKHLLEEGFNAIQFSDVFNCWVKNVRFIDADMGLKVNGARFCQGEELEFVEAKREGMTGHHAIWASGNAQECLFQGFRVETTYVHDLTVEGLANGNVFRNGSGRSINLDHHRNAPYENLFTNLDVGDPKRLWRSSGRGDRGPHSAARTTAWNLRHQGGEVHEPSRPSKMWPQLNVVGVAGYEEKKSDERWTEPLSGIVDPPDIYQAQLERRLAEEGR